jgi:hypothetical protein
MNSSLLTSLSATQIATASLCLLAAWGFWKNFRHLTPEDGVVEKTIKVTKTLSALIPNIGLILAALTMPFFVSGIWPISIAAILYSLFQIYRISSKFERLNDEINILYQSESILSINLGTIDHTEYGMPLKIWFKRGKDAWPVAELQISVGCCSGPIECIRPQIVLEHFLPRINYALQSENNDDWFYNIKVDLLEQGVSHPIDIKGWDSNPIIREMIERIMNANPPQQIHTEEPIVKVA